MAWPRPARAFWCHRERLSPGRLAPNSRGGTWCWRTAGSPRPGPGPHPASRARCGWTAPAASPPRASSRRTITCSSGSPAAWPSRALCRTGWPRSTRSGAGWTAGCTGPRCAARSACWHCPAAAQSRTITTCSRAGEMTCSPPAPRRPVASGCGCTAAAARWSAGHPRPAGPGQRAGIRRRDPRRHAARHHPPSRSGPGFHAARGGGPGHSAGGHPGPAPRVRGAGPAGGRPAAHPPGRERG